MIRNLPQSLIEAAQEYIQIQLYESIMLVENRVQFLKDKNPEIDTSHDHFAQYKNSSDIIDHFATNADPTPNKVYTQWIIGQYKKGNIRQEDVDRLHTELSKFHSIKHNLDKKDINQYKSISEVSQSNASIDLEKYGKTKKEQSKIAEAKGRTIIHDDPSGLKVYRLEPTPEGKQASQDIYMVEGLHWVVVILIGALLQEVKEICFLNSVNLEFYILYTHHLVMYIKHILQQSN